MASDISDDDDDIPGLESVSSCEYVTEDEKEEEEAEQWDSDGYSESFTPRWLDPEGKHYKTAKQWLEQDQSVIDKNLNVIIVYLYSPFLYGYAHQTDRWLRWCSEAGLLRFDTDYNTDCLSIRERYVVDLLSAAVEHCRNIMRESAATDAVALLLQLAEVVQGINTIEDAVKTAREERWFMIMLQEFKMRPPRTEEGNGIFKNNSLETAFLYVINQTAEHVQKVVHEKYDFIKEFEDKIFSDQMLGEQLKKGGDDEVKVGKHKEAVDIYSTAIICCPYYHKLYISRALSYSELKNHKGALSDGLRAMLLNPDLPKGYICYMLALWACAETKLVEEIHDEYYRRFPGSQDRKMLEDALEAENKREIEPSEKDRVVHDRLMGTCTRASELYLNDNFEEAMFYYEEALASAKTDMEWNHCMARLECNKFIVSLHFAYGLCLLKNGSSKCAEMALTEFNTITEKYKTLKFIAAQWGAAQALVQLHRHSSAFALVGEALQQLSMIKVVHNMTWPGTVKSMSETLTQNVETNLLKIQQKCEPVSVPDAICRYLNCLSHHLSTHISIISEEYKGHVLLACSETCLISYHSSCWRRFKSESVISSDRDFLLTPCPTPDCSGQVKTVTIYDMKGKIKIKFDLPSSKAPPLAYSVPPHQLSKDTSKNSIKSRLTSGEQSLDKKASTLDSTVTESQEPAVHQTNIVDNSSLPKVEPVDEEMSVVKEKDLLLNSVSEDLRQVEDSVVIINRQAEVEDQDSVETVAAKPKAKKKKAKTSLTKEHWDDLFMLPERPSRFSEATAFEQDARNKISTWEPDPDAPFQPPEHLREAIEQFENEMVPRMVLEPRPSSLTGATPKYKPPKDVEFIISFFCEIFKSHGGLHPSDSKLTDALGLLSEDSREIIEKTGGIGQFLLTSPLFISHGELICLSEDASIIAASISSVGGSTSSDSSSNHIGPSGGSLSTDSDRSAYTNTQDSRKTYGEELTSGVNSPAISPLLSPHPLSPLSSPKINKRSTGVDRSSSQRNSKDAGGSKHTATHTQTQQKHTQSRNSSDKKEKKVERKYSPQSGSKKHGRDLSPSTNKNSAAKPVMDEPLGNPSDTIPLSKHVTTSKGGAVPPLIVKIPVTSVNENGFIDMREAGMLSSEDKLTLDWDREIEKLQWKLGSGDGKTDGKKEALPGRLVSIGINACPLVTEKWVMTDPVPLVENFKDRYESVLKEKSDLQSKLESSEDQRFKMQRDHKREIEKVQKKCKAETREECLARITDLEQNIIEEKGRVAVEKKDHLEQTRSLKSEIKSLSDKIEKFKKESVKKDRQVESNVTRAHVEVQEALKEQKKLEDRLRAQTDHSQMALHRASNAEKELLNMRRESVLRPGEHRLREVNGIFNALPPDYEHYEEWREYRDKLKTSLDCFQNAMDDQLKQVVAGKSIAQLDPVPNPSVPFPQQLASSRLPFIPMMMRPGMQPGPFPPRPLDPGPFPPRPLDPGPFPPRPLDPGPFPPRPLYPAQFPPRPLDPAQFPPRPLDPGPFPPRPLDQAQIPPRPLEPMFNPVIKPPAALNTGPVPPGSLVDGQATAVGPSGHASSGTQQSLFNDQSPGASLATDLDIGSSKKSSSDRIIETLAPVYPQYTKNDFKSVIREVRRNNNNTLSGLSLEKIILQVRSIIDARLKVTVGGPVSSADKPLMAGGVVSGKGSRRVSKGQSRKQSHPATVANPPRLSEAEYDNEEACIICYEQMTEQDSQLLNCGHKFHSECIRSWFNEQSTCPTCRNHSLLPDEYPQLQ